MLPLFILYLLENPVVNFLMIESGEAKPGDLNVARQLLKDNGIECIPTEKSPMEDLMSNLPDLDVIPSIER